MAELDIVGVRVGHRSDTDHRTGCTVVRFDVDNVASGEVRGGAPATREFALLDPRRLVSRLDAVVLTGGSAFGLAACDGVTQQLEEDGVGFPTQHGRVPIVVGMGLYDLGVGSSTVRPDATWGRHATASASATFDVGAVGAGIGATVGKWRGEPSASGLGCATVEAGAVRVAAIVAVNAVGDIAGTSGGDAAEVALDDGSFAWAAPPALGENTTIGVIVTNAALSKIECRGAAEAGHDGLARALRPAHTPFDGDALVAVSVGDVGAPLPTVRTMAAHAVQRAVESVRSG